MLKDQTAIIPEKARRKALAKQKKRAVEESSKEPSRGMSQDTEVSALCFFFTNFVTTARDHQASRGFLEYLLPLYSSVAHDSPLSLATSALAVLLHQVWLGKGPDSSLSHQFFGKAIRLTSVAINDSEQNKTDVTLMTVLLLEFYDILIGATKSQSSPGAHQNGAVALIKHRGEINFRNETSKRLLIAVRHQLIALAIEKQQPLNNDLELWSDMSEMPASPAIEIDKLAAEYASLRSFASQYTFPTPPSPITRSPSPGKFEAPQASVDILHHILAPALELDARLATWPKTIPTFWHPIPKGDLDPTIVSAGLYGATADIYPSLMIANVMNSYRSTRLGVLRIILSCESSLNALQETSSIPGMKGYVHDTCQSLLDAICASVPYHLGNRTKPASVHNPSQIYPHLDPEEHVSFPPPNALGYAISITKEEHVRYAAIIGGWYLQSHLVSIMKTFSNVAKPDDEGNGPMRLGQLEWIMGQLKRLKDIYKITTVQSSDPEP